ncbi:unnamed protein product, partial [Brassica oleracea var. botrytis]
QIDSIEIHINLTIHVLYLSIILKNREGDLNTVAQISKLGVGQVYAASVMYWYFLKRIDQRFQLEKAMKILPGGSDEGINARGGSSSEMKQSRLKMYVMSFDGETLQRYATIRSREAVGIIEKHTEALFGRPEIVITPQGIDSSKDEHIQISFKGLKRLVLEAVTFGSFLWDVESLFCFRDGHLSRRRLRSCFFVLDSLKTLLSYGCRAVKFKTAESMFPSADRSSKEEQENDRNRSVMVQSTTDLDLTFETEGMVESNYDAASKLTSGRNSQGSII